MHPTSRGVGLWSDKVFFAAADAVLVALDVKTGKETWTAKVEDYKRGYYMSLAPLVIDGKVLVGVSGGELGVRGFVAAYDAETGKELWKTYMVPAPGEPGSETWPQGDQWKTGGGSVWVTGTYDAETNLTFWGTGNGGPWMGDQRPGDNLYTSSVVALDAATGAIKGHFQYHQNNSWDWDEVSPPILIDYMHNGRSVKGLVNVARDGYLWQLERTKDKINFVTAQPFVRQNTFRGVDPKTGRPDVDPNRKPGTNKPAEFCPSLWGGKDWPPAAFNPQTRLLYIPANENLCAVLSGVESPKYTPGERYTGVPPNLSIMKIVAGADHIGELQAWNIDTGKRVWTTNMPAMSQNWGPVLATGGGLLFAGGTNDRRFRAFDAKSGQILWEVPMSSGVTGVPVSFEVDGTQFIAVQSGWGVGFSPHAGAPQPAVPGQVSGCPAGRCGLGIRPEIELSGFVLTDKDVSPGLSGPWQRPLCSRASPTICYNSHATQQALEREEIMAARPRDFLLSVALLAGATAAFGQTVVTDTRPAGKIAQAAIPDFSGIWAHPFLTGFEPPASGPGPVLNTSRSRNGVANFQLLVGDYTNPILKPHAAAIVKKSGETSRAGSVYPTPSNQCWPGGVPYVFWDFLMQMFQTPDQITFVYRHGNEVRRVRMNEPHPAKVTPSWYGDSVGHYEGDTLVIDTVGTKIGPFAMVDMYGTPFTEKLHVVERYRLVDYDNAKDFDRA